MRLLPVLVAVAAALALSAAAFPGGARVMPVNTLPQTLRAGETWVAKLRVTNCAGAAAVTGMKPWVAIRNVETGERRVFHPLVVRREDEWTMIYEARVAFPSAGAWRYAVGDRSDAYGWFAVEIGSAAGAAPTGSGQPLTQVSAGGAALVVFAASAFAARRRRRR